MRNRDEFKEEVLRRATEGLKRKERAKRKVVRILSMAACFVCIVGILSGVAPMLNRLYSEQAIDAFPSTPVTTTPQSHAPLATSTTGDAPISTTPHASTPHASTPVASIISTPAATTPAASFPADSTPVASSQEVTTPVSTEPRATSPTVTTAPKPEEILINFDKGPIRDEPTYFIRIVPHESPVLSGENLAK